MIIKESDIRFDIIDALSNGCRTINDIYSYLSKKYSKEEIKYWINILLANEEKIVRTDNYYNDNTYSIVSKRQQKSPYTKHFIKFVDDNPTRTKKVLLISDTHIGNKQIENIDLINAIYEYALEKECEYVFHEGDLFEGYGDEKEQLKTFIKEYPQTIKTICLLGNHDEIFNNKISIKELNKYNESFNFYELDKWETLLNKIPLHMSHRLYISWLIDNQKLDCIDDIYEVEKWVSNDYKVLISGHLHQGIIHSVNDEMFDKLYLGVPSLTNINIGKSCAYILTIYDDIINISVLSVDKKLDIKEIDNITWNTKGKNKVLHKAYL